MERRPVAIHQYHSRGEVEAAGGEDADRRSRVEGLAGDHSRGIEIVAAARQDQDREQRHGHNPCHAYYCHAALEFKKEKLLPVVYDAGFSCLSTDAN